MSNESLDKHHKAAERISDWIHDHTHHHVTDAIRDYLWSNFEGSEEDRQRVEEDYGFIEYEIRKILEDVYGGR